MNKVKVNCRKEISRQIGQLNICVWLLCNNSNFYSNSCLAINRDEMVFGFVSVLFSLKLLYYSMAFLLLITRLSNKSFMIIFNLNVLLNSNFIAK